MSNIFSLVDVWNDSGKVFKAISMDVTNIASAANSALLDFGVGGVSFVFCRKDGRVGFGTDTPNAAQDFRGVAGESVGGFPGGSLHVTSLSADVNANAVITGHNLFGGNKQLWYFGSVSGSNDNVAFINRQTGTLSLQTSGFTGLTIDVLGDTTLGGSLTVGGAITNTLGDLDVTTETGGVFKFTSTAFQAGLDAANFIEIGHGGSNSFVNQVGAGGMDFRFGGTTKATFTSFGHLHLLTDVDQKHTLKIVTADNLNDTGISWENSGGSFTHSIFRTDVGANRADLVFAAGQDANVDLLTNSFKIHGSSATEGNVEFLQNVGIGTSNPDVTAILDIKSTTKGFLPPRMTTAARDAIVSPASGLEIYNTTVDKDEIFTGATWKTILTEDLGQILVQETFAASNVRFFGELGLPAAQGWTDTPTGIATIDLVTQTVFGEVKQVVRHNDDSSGATTSDIALTTQNWIDINAFGASYGGSARLDTANGGSGFFSGLQANSAENPLATGNRRYGVLFDNSGGNLRVREADNTGNAVIMDGTGGNPLVTFDEWFLWECVIPAGLGAAEFYVNSILTNFIPTFLVNGGGLGTAIKIGSGSSSGVNRIVYHDNFGVTIFEEAATKTLSAATMAGDVAQINIPEGKRDYTIVLPDGNPRPIGSVLRLVANNLLGSISLENENPAVPEILYNGLRTLVINVAVKETIEGINTISSGNVYLGFQTGDIDQTKSIFAQLSSSVDQNPVDTNPVVITYNTQDEISGITHSTTVNSGEITIDLDGVYFVSPQSQVGKTTGATKVDFDIFWQIDRGSGFVDEPNSNVKLTIKDADVTDVIVSAFTIKLSVGDKIRMMQKTSSSTAGMGLKNTDPVVGPPTVPRTPSISLTIHRVGGIPA